MRRKLLVVTSMAIALMTIAAAATAAELAIPPRKPPAEVSVQKGPPNCAQWTDECVNCARGTSGDAPVCSNIGFACQPKEIRCLIPDKSQNK